MLDFVVTNEQEVRVVLTGEIDHHSSAVIRPLIDEKIMEFQPKSLVLDFSGITFMDSSGVGLIMGRYKLINEIGGEIYVINIPKYLRHVMKMSGLNKLAKFDFEEETLWK